MTNNVKPVGVALLGCGRVSHAHIGAILQQPDVGELVAVVDTNVDLARAVAKQFGVPLALSSLDEALTMDNVEAIDVCLPNHLHVESTVQALNGGRHVLVEKPMAPTEGEARKMAAAAEAAGKILVTAQSRRHSSAIRYVQDNAAKFGRLRSIEASFCMYWAGPQAPWWRDRTPEQGLVLSQLGSHTLDFVQMMMGHQPTRVHAEAVRWRDCWAADDEAMILLRYPENRLASVHISYDQQPFHERYHLFYDGCVVEVRDVNTVLINDEVVHRPPQGEDATQLVTNELFRNQFAEFAAAVQGKPNRSALHPQGVALTRVIDAALRSALNGHTIELSWPVQTAA